MCGEWVTLILHIGTDIKEGRVVTVTTYVLTTSALAHPVDLTIGKEHALALNNWKYCRAERV